MVTAVAGCQRVSVACASRRLALRMIVRALNMSACWADRRDVGFKARCPRLESCLDLPRPVSALFAPWRAVSKCELYNIHCSVETNRDGLKLNVRRADRFGAASLEVTQVVPRGAINSSARGRALMAPMYREPVRLSA